ncbi:MAG TPA: hypothetical protein VHU61_00985 [Solirubrobacteraceae bacterium]|jgi:hypothetical protein|nr:hypothetical protein [Solirubrobacteraceae bacterium]
MKKYLFSSKTVLALLAAGAFAAVPAASASAATNSSTIFATLQGTSVLGHEIPVLGTQGFDITLPIGSNVLPGESIVWNAIDFTVSGDVKLGNLEILNLYIDPKMAR